MFDATLLTEARSFLGFSSLEAGLLFIGLDVPYLLLGLVAGWAVDKYGSKPAAVFGFAYLVPTLVLLRLPTEGFRRGDKMTLILWCALLALNGMGMAIVGFRSIIEANYLVQKYEKANQGLFGENGPYAQLCGFQSLTFSARLSLGPAASGGLRDSVGYGNMNAVFAAIAAVTAVFSLLFIGSQPRWLRELFEKFSQHK